jgi:CRISPR-associated protein Cmr5
MQTRDQKYAATVYAQVQEIAGMPQDKQKKYGSMAHKLPVLIRTAGLAQALAFVEARGDQEMQKGLLLEHLALAIGKENRAELLEGTRTTELAMYMRLTQAVLAALLWYKRFAQSVLDVQASDEEGNTND